MVHKLKSNTFYYKIKVDNFELISETIKVK